MNKKELDLSIIIVNYNSKQLLQKCLESVFAETSDLNFEVFVVDNNSNDDSPEMVKKLFPKVRLMQNSKNIGFAKANNQAISESQGRYVLLLNPDTVVFLNTITNLVRFMDVHPDAGAAGGKLLNPDGSIQFSMRNFPTLSNQLSECFFLHHMFPKINLFGEMICNNKRYEKIQSIDWVSGAALMVRREVINRIGALDENFFLYSEEKDWCYRIRRDGWQVYYYPEAQFMHYHGESGTNPKLFIHLIQGRLKFSQKHNGFLETWVLKRILVLKLLVRVSFWSILAFANQNSEKAKIKLKVYKEGLTVI